MKLRVLGCNGGASLHHRPATFLLDDLVAMDAGALCAGLTLAEQDLVRAALITHAHIDHVGDLAHLVELRSQRGDHPLVVAGRRETVDALRAHYFNDVIWPDFTAIPLPDGPALELQVLELESVTSIEHLRVRAIPVNHSVPACGFIVGDGRSSVAYTGDTGPTDRFWSALEDVEDLRAVITEVSFPNRLAELGRISKHLVPLTFRDEIAKFRNRRDVPVLICHLKSVFEEEIKAELLALELESVRVLSLGETLQF